MQHATEAEYLDHAIRQAPPEPVGALAAQAIAIGQSYVPIIYSAPPRMIRDAAQGRCTTCHKNAFDCRCGR